MGDSLDGEIRVAGTGMGTVLGMAGGCSATMTPGEKAERGYDTSRAEKVLRTNGKRPPRVVLLIYDERENRLTPSEWRFVCWLS
jgi:hypothetical protein